jgi:integrative and conjugative element protein (TIGR02256 family)
MQFLSEWATADRRRLVVLSAEVVRTLVRYRQRFPWQTEAGGILIGRRRGNHIEVALATEPARHDRRSPYMFEREAFGHSEAATLAWRIGGGTVDYVGEWHTHPQKVPVPSSIDRREWKKIAEQRPAATLVVVVVGTQRLHLEMVTSRGQFPLSAFAQQGHSNPGQKS